MSANWLQTYTGQVFIPEDPHPDQINIRDIAHSLSMQVRYNGHLDQFYSVAQHSVLCSLIIEKDFALCALLHDATEAYVGDVPSPIKALLPGFCALEDRIYELAIAPKFGLPAKLPPEVKRVDREVLKMEYTHLVKKYGHDWHLDEIDVPEGFSDTGIYCLKQELAKDMFLNRFYELTGES